MLFIVASALAVSVLVALNFRGTQERICGHVATPDLFKTPTQWLWSHGRAFHLFRLRAFLAVWCATIGMLAVLRLVPGLVEAFGDGGEVSVRLVCAHAITAAALVGCLIVCVHLALMVEFERAVYWMMLSFQLLFVADLLDLDGTELDVVKKTFEHMAFLTAMVLTLFPADFELSVLKITWVLSVLSFIVAHVVVLCAYGQARVIFSTIVLCVGLKCASLRLNSLELDVILRKALPNTLQETVAELGESQRETMLECRTLDSPQTPAPGGRVTPTSEKLMRRRRLARSGMLRLGATTSFGPPETPSEFGGPPTPAGPRTPYTPYVPWDHQLSLTSLGEVDEESRPATARGCPLPIRVLSIDGGGSKGVGAFKALEMMESSLGKPLHELYDFFIGSSIGGAVLVGKLVSGYDFDKFYARLAPAMARFGRGQSVLRLLCTGSTQTEEETMRFLQACIDEDLMHRPFDAHSGNAALAPIAITASKHNADGTSQTHLVCNYDRNDPWEIGDAVRATTCFPTVCPPFQRNGQTYLDGGLLANNPSLEGFHEASALFPGRSVAIFHSIGMGGVKDFNDGGLVDAPADNNYKPLLMGSMRNNMNAILATVAETGAGTNHVRALLGIFHPEATLRRLELPLSHHGVFPSREAEYEEITQETVRFLGTSQVYQDMVDEHLEYFDDRKNTRKNTPCPTTGAYSVYGGARGTPP